MNGRRGGGAGAGGGGAHGGGHRVALGSGRRRVVYGTALNGTHELRDTHPAHPLAEIFNASIDRWLTAAEVNRIFAALGTLTCSLGVTGGNNVTGLFITHQQIYRDEGRPLLSRAQPNTLNDNDGQNSFQYTRSMSLGVGGQVYKRRVFRFKKTPARLLHYRCISEEQYNLFLAEDATREAARTARQAAREAREATQAEAAAQAQAAAAREGRKAAQEARKAAQAHANHGGISFISEQVSHHPPMSAGHAENEHFTYDFTSKLKTKLLGNVDVYPVGRTRVTLKKDGVVMDLLN